MEPMGLEYSSWWRWRTQFDKVLSSQPSRPDPDRKSNQTTRLGLDSEFNDTAHHHVADPHQDPGDPLLNTVT
ncbi:hypothetical protein Pst134EA_017196 [Puccinia striiformis f. sp. tritici]|uniref:hypothetical protein n=1 Tax=Puccinia striiformis f. sp. tritici TaxID=168172 RepID=UPI0020080407|nr:hypothetical protein Pst134EA_017196 [Puccinia striiformis f. sp. tritici]KAH9460883.1 hypothetical protein Pst134EA_017196 [Puccinia striiformis f. sp. tritici]